MNVQKLYVQYVPDDDSRHLLTELQSKLAKISPKSTAVPTDELHVTILHFGHLAETYKQLSAINTGINRQQYNDAADTFIKGLATDMPAECRLTISDVAYFGPRAGALVLTLSADLCLIKAYEHSMACLRGFAKELGINSVADIPPQPRALQVQAELVPHISLLKQVSQTAELNAVAQRFIGKSLQFQLDALTS